MRNYLLGLPRQRLAGALVFLTAFGLFAFTTQPLTGYEPETAAVTEGLVLEGHFWDKEDSGLPLKANFPGRGGHYYSTAGLLQPLLETPFFAAGHFIDATFGWFNAYPFGYVALWFFNPFMAATMVAVALAVWARSDPTRLTWGLTGLASGAAIATKPYALVTLTAIAILLWPTFRALDRRRRTELALAACLPLLAWLAAIGWYNWVRFGSVTDSGYHESLLTMTAPLNFLGLLFSPGKGLIFYSPLVVLGALGMPRLWRQDRSLAAALLVLLVGMTCIAGSTTFWGDEVWGPRYVVPAAWALLVPIAWWADSAVRRKVLVAVASLGVFVQVVGVSAQYAHYVDVVDALTGVPVYQDRFGVDREEIPYGNDPTRWVPELSALLIQTEGLVSSQIVDRLGGDGLEVTYAPFEGRTRTVNLSDPRLKMPLDFWWYPPPEHKWLVRFLALLLLLATAATAAALYRVSFGRSA